MSIKGLEGLRMLVIISPCFSIQGLVGNTLDLNHDHLQFNLSASNCFYCLSFPITPQEASNILTCLKDWMEEGSSE